MKKRVYIVLLMIIVLCVIHIPPDMPAIVRTCLPDWIERNAWMSEHHENVGWQDRYDIRVFRMLAGDSAAFYEEASKIIDLKAFPMTGYEQGTFIRRCCGWAIGACDLICDMDFSDESSRGWWWYSGTYDENEDEPSCYIGHHEMILWIEAESEYYLVYMVVNN